MPAAHNTPKSQQRRVVALHAAHGSAALDYDQWERQGGDTDGIMRTVCHQCERMWPMAAMTEDDRFDNICPSCMAERQNDKLAHGPNNQKP